MIFLLYNAGRITYTPLPYPFSVFTTTFCPNWDRSKINKQGCCLARKGHGNGVIEDPGWNYFGPNPEGSQPNDGNDG